MPHVVKICSQVEGLPLGIELTAAWIRTIPCAEISRELERGSDAPASRQRNRPKRHQSVHAAIAFSWQLLTPEQQEVLAALSEFRGGFTREAAEAVAQASLRIVSALVDKALVRRASDHRYSLHPLVRAFAGDELARSRRRQSAIRTRHGDHYLRVLAGQRLALNGAQHREARFALEDDLDNIRAAWTAKVISGDPNAVREGARPLCVILDRLGLYDEWVRTFEDALAVFPAKSSDDSRAACCRLLIGAAYGHWRRGDASRARSYQDQVAEHVATTRDDSTLADLHKLLGLIERESGDFDAALRHFELGAQAARDAADTIAQSQLANETGVIQWRRGKLGAALEAFAASLQICELSANVFDLPTCLHNVGFCDMELGRFDAADVAFGRALTMFRESASSRGETMVLSSLGILARRRGDFASAEAHSRASLALAERMSSPGAVADALDDLAQVVEMRQDYTQAESLYARALVMARGLGQVHLQCFVLLHLARTQAAAGRAKASAASLREAFGLADAHDFQTGRLMAILGAAGLRSADGDADARAAARRWCLAALAAGGTNMEVKDAVPSALRAVLDESVQSGVEAPDDALKFASTDVLSFLDRLAA